MVSKGPAAVVATVLLWSAQAWAEQDDAPAVEALRQAAELMAAGQCEGAIPLLQRAVRIGGLRNAMWNMAECYRNLDRPGLAIEAYRTYLDHPETQRRRRDQAEARAAIARLQPQVAVVTINCSVEHASVSIDGQHIGEAPLVTHVGRGLRNVEVSSPGFTTWRQQVQIEPGEDRELSAELELQPGELTVTSEPSGARFTIDGDEGGVTPAAVDVTGGGHIVEVRLGGHRTAQRRVNVPPGQRIAIEVTLTPSAGSLAVAADAEDAVLEVDGTARGTSPFAPLSLSPGRHQIDVTAPRHASWSSELDILDERTTTVEVELAETSGVNQSGFWTLATTGVAGLAAGVVLVVNALRRGVRFNSIANDIEDGGNTSAELDTLQQDGEDAADQTNRWLWSGVAVLATGGAAALSAIVLAFFTRFSRGTSSAEVRVEDRDEGPPPLRAEEAAP